MTTWWDLFADPRVQAVVVFGPLLVASLALACWPRKGQDR